MHPLPPRSGDRRAICESALQWWQRSAQDAAAEERMRREEDNGSDRHIDPPSPAPL
jgi:hypothetical protein